MISLTLSISYDSKIIAKVNVDRQTDRTKIPPDLLIKGDQFFQGENSKKKLTHNFIKLAIQQL